jgi:hypothetical protein
MVCSASGYRPRRFGKLEIEITDSPVGLDFSSFASPLLMRSHPILTPKADTASHVKINHVRFDALSSLCSFHTLSPTNPHYAVKTCRMRHEHHLPILLLWVTEYSSVKPGRMKRAIRSISPTLAARSSPARPA